jgi:hypothetical protein
VRGGHDGSDNQVESTCAITLVLEAAGTQVALSVEEDSTGEGVSGFTFVESDLDTPAQLRVFHPVQHEKRALDAAHFAKRCVEAILTGIAGELADDKRGGHRACRMDAASRSTFLQLELLGFGPA